jgi:hypothetical protein
MVCFRTKNPQFGQIFEGLRIKNVGVFYGYLEYFMVIWHMYICILWPLGNVVVTWYIYHRFGKLCQEKSGYPG